MQEKSIYVAWDGNEFYSKDECLEYESVLDKTYEVIIRVYEYNCQKAWGDSIHRGCIRIGVMTEDSSESNIQRILEHMLGHRYNFNNMEQWGIEEIKELTKDNIRGGFSNIINALPYLSDSSRRALESNCKHLLYPYDFSVFDKIVYEASRDHFKL